MPVLERGGERIFYEVSGDGPPVVLGHSLLCDGRMWDGVVPSLARTHRVVNVDFRGHRHSSGRVPFSLEDLADDWLAIMDAEKIDRAALVGLSMGGMVSMRLALRAPDRVAAMVILDSAAAPESLRKKIEYGVMAETFRRIGPLDPLIARALKILFGKTAQRARPELLEREAARTKEQDPLGIYHATHAVVRRRSIEKELAAIKAPTLVIAGTEDTATTPERNEQIAAGIPGTALILLPHVGHLSAVEAPEQVAREIEGHLGRCGW